MRHIRIVMFVMDSDNPGAELDSILEDGAEANGYSVEAFDVESNVDGYVRLKKE